MAIILCSVVGCNNVAKYKKIPLCPMHYARQYKYGDINVIKKPHKIPENTKCIVNGCNRNVTAKSMCKLHYTRKLKTGTTEVIKKTRGKCLVDGCDKRTVGHGYCSAHYERFMAHGDPLAGRNPYKSRVGKCEVKSCQFPIYMVGLCKTHYAVWNKYHVDPRNSVKCYICGKEYEDWPARRIMSIDHNHPKIKGGKSILSNLKPACFSCNRRKGSDTMEELIEWCKSILSLHVLYGD